MKMGKISPPENAFVRFERATWRRGYYTGLFLATGVMIFALVVSGLAGWLGR
jgi:hypothetical protein